MNELADFAIRCFVVPCGIAFGIVFIYFWFKLISHFFEKMTHSVNSVNIVGIKNFVDAGTNVNITLGNGKTHENVLFLGFTDLTNQKGIPFNMHNWVVAEGDAGKMFIKPDSIKMIAEIKPTT